MTTSIFHRETCRLCGSKHVERVLKLEPIPLSENYASNAETGRQVARYPVDLYMCRACGHVQQLDVVDSKSLWENYTYYSGEAKGMPEHFAQVAAKTLATYRPAPGSLIIDIGSNDGSLLRCYKEAGHRVLGIDPATAIAQKATEAGIPTIPQLMSRALAKNIRVEHGPAQIVCVFNAFAHADNMDELTDAIRVLLAPDGLLIFEAQYLVDIVEKVLIATIFHEHMSHHSVKPLIPFLDRHGLQLIAVERVEIQHGSIIGVAQVKGGGRAREATVDGLLQLEAKLKLDDIDTLRGFASKVAQLREQTTRLVRKWKSSGASIAGYGAARSGPTLIAQLGLTGALDYILDDHPQKVNRYTSGDGIPIVRAEELVRRMPDYVVILAWVHAEKIIRSNPDYLEKGGRFVVLCPETRVLGKEDNVGELL